MNPEHRFKTAGEPRTDTDRHPERATKDQEGLEMTNFGPTITKAEVEEMELRLMEAIKTSDLDFLDQLIHPYLIGLAPGGQRFTKETDLASHREGSMVVEELVPEMEEIRIIGDTAIVVITYLTKGKMLGTPVEGKFRYNRVWKKCAGELKIITVSCMQMEQ
jgi:hypothetical protein